MAELDGGNDEFAGGKVIIDNTAQEDEFSGGNVVVDNTSSKKKAVSQPPLGGAPQEFRDISAEGQSGASGSEVQSTSGVNKVDPTQFAAAPKQPVARNPINQYSEMQKEAVLSGQDYIAPQEMMGSVAARQYEQSQANLVNSQKAYETATAEDRNRQTYYDIPKGSEWINADRAKVNLGKSQITADENIPKLKESIKGDLEYVGSNLESFTRKAFEGDVIADEINIGEYAKEQARKKGLPEDGYYKDFLYNNAKAEVAQKIIEPDVLKEREKLFKEKTGKSIADAFGKDQEDFAKGFVKGEQIKLVAETQINSVRQEVETLAKADIDALSLKAKQQTEQLSQEYKQQAEQQAAATAQQAKAQVDQLSKEYQQQAAQAVDEAQSKALYDDYVKKFNQLQAQAADETQSATLFQTYESNFNKLQADLLDEQNRISGKYNSRLRRQADEIEKVAARKWEEEANKYNKEYKADPKLLEQLKTSSEEAYTKVVNSKNTVKQARDLYMPPVFNFVRQSVSGLGRSLGSLSEAAGYDQGKVLGDYMENSFQVGSAELKEWGDLLNANKLAGSGGQLLGAMVPSMGAATITTIATQGMGAPAAITMLAGSLAAWTGESMDMAGNIQRETFAATGDANKALKASKMMWDSQMRDMWMYTFGALPLTKGISLSKNIVKRVAGGAVLEYIPEVVSEWSQNKSEEAIRKGIALEDKYKGATWEEFGHTALNVAPIIGVGAAGQIRGEKSEQEKALSDAKKFAKTYAKKEEFAELAPDQRDQFLSAMLQQKGVNFTSAFITNLYTNAKITKEAANELTKSMGIAMEVQAKAKEYGFDQQQQQVFTAFKYKLAAAQEKAAEETDPILKKVAEQRVKELEEQTVNFASGKQADYVVLTYPNNEQYVLSLSQAQNAAKNKKLIASIQDGSMKVDGVGKGVEVVNGIAEVIDLTKPKDVAGVSEATEADTRETKPAPAQIDETLKEINIKGSDLALDKPQRNDFKEGTNGDIDYAAANEKHNKNVDAVISNLTEEGTLTDNQGNEYAVTITSQGVRVVGLAKDGTETNNIPYRNGKRTSGEAPFVNGFKFKPKAGSNNNEITKEENAGVKQPDEVVFETRETEDAPVAPKENDTIELLPILDGYPNRKMVFKDGEWQASAGGKETSKVSDAVQKAAQEAFEKGNKPDTINAKEQVEGHKQNDGSTFMSGKDMGGTPNEAVSIFPERTKINKGNNVSEQDIVDFKEKNKDLLEGNEDVLGVGTWYDKKTDQTYIDVTSIIPKEHAKEAHELGRDYNQKETVSLEDFKSTDTGGDGTIKEGWKKEKDRIAEIRQAQKGEYIKSKEQPKAEAPKKEKPLSKKEAQLKEIEEKRKADAEKAIESTKKALKATGIDLIADKEAYDKAVRDKKGQEGGDGIFISEDGKIYLNPEKFKDADGRVIVFHEGTHPIMNIIRNTNRKLYDSIVKGLKKAAETNDGVKDVKAWAEREYRKDGEVVIEDEFITETIARIADGTLKLDEIPPTLKQQVIDFINTAAKMLGFEEVLSDTDPVAFKKLAEQVANALKEGKDVSEIVGESNLDKYGFEVSQLRKVKERDLVFPSVKVPENPQLSLVKKSDLFDFKKLLDEIFEKDEKVFFWQADQLGKGKFKDSKGAEHEMDAGLGYALDSQNKKDGKIWATSEPLKGIQDKINKSAYTFIVSGSELSSKKFNKKVFDVFANQVGDFEVFKSDIKKAYRKSTGDKTPILDILNDFNSWDELRNSPQRKELLNQVSKALEKQNTPLKQSLVKSGAEMDYSALRDDFLRENDFKQNDIMLVLKPSEIKEGDSGHSTYSNTVYGEVVGVPDVVVNAFDILPTEKQKTAEGNIPKHRGTQSAKVAPYGKGLSEIQQSKGNRGDYAKNTYLEPHLTKNEKGDYVFFHVSDAGKKALEKGIDSRKQNSTRTSKEEKGLQYGVASFYTKPSDGEGMVGGEKYQVTVAPEKVYPMDTDPNGYKEKAEQKVKEGTPFRRENIKKQMAEMARKDGYEMAVAEWNYDRSGKGDGKLALRADALVPLKAEDLKETSPATDKQIPHPDQQEILNQEKINDLAQDIYDYKSKKEEYDDAYSIAQDIITYGEKPSAEDFKTMTDGAPKKLQEKIKEAKSAAQFSKGNRNKNVDDYHDDYVKVAKLGLEENPNYTIDDLAQDTGFKKEDLQGVWDEATGNEAPKETTGGGKKKTLVTKRVYEGDFKEEVKKKLEEIGLYRKEIPFEEAEKTAKKAIDEVGIDAALDAVRDGDIIGGAAAEVYAAKLLDIDKKMLKETDPIEFDKLAGEFAEITDEAGREQTNAGQYNAQWAKIYKETDLGFNVEKKIKEFKDQNNGVIPPEIEAKFRENDRQIKELTAKISELEAEAEKAKAEAAVKEIQESLDREKKNKVTEQRASDKIRKQTDKLVAKVERAKFHRPTTFNMASPASLAWDSAVNVVEATIVITGRTAEGVARAVEAGLDHIKETDWYKNLEEKKQKEAEKAYREFFDAEEKTNGKIKIPHSLIREKVEGGADTIEKLTKEIQDAIKEEYPDATEREVRDAITKYGEVVNPNKEQIEVEIRKIKRLGKLLSQLEDIQNKKRPLKSGQQRDKMDAEERAKMKEVREAMKDLPIDATLEAEQLKTATDAAKQRIRNQIEDLQREIDKGEQVPKNSRSIQEDAELKDLKDKRDKIKAEHEALFKDEEANRLEQAIKAAEKSILEYERRIKEGELYPDKKQSAIETPELKALRDKRDVLKDEIERLKKIKPIAGASTGWDNKTGKFYVEINGKRIKEFDTRKEAENFAFGRTPEQVATEAAIKAAERQADELERRIQAGELEVAKKQSLVQNTSELQSARERLSKQREELRKLQEDAGIIERKRLEQAKKNAERRIAELQRRINEGDFSKKERKPLIADTELTRLRAEKIRLQEEYEKEIYKNKLANRTTMQIVKDALGDIWGLTQVLSATGEMSFVLIQGLTQSVAHPKIAGEAFKTALRFMFSEKKTEQWLYNLKAQDFYPELKQSKLSITQPHAEITAREELFYSDHVNMVWNFLGLPLKYKSPEAYKTWQAASPLKAFERAAVGYLDTLRVMRYLDGRQLLQDKGITFENNPEAYKDMADVLNTLTGRASLGFAEQVAPQLTKVFFSPRNWASVIKTATPYGFIWLGKKRAGAESWKPSVAQKMALSDLSKVIGATAGIVALAALKYNNDDDDETSVELDPRSSDFGKIKLGNTRVDPWGGRVQQVVFMSRLIADAMHYAAPDKFAGGFKNAKGEVVPLGTPYKAPSSEAIMINMAINKLSPSASLVENFLSKVPAEGGGYTDERGNPYSFKEDLKEKIHPIYWSTVAEMLKDDPTAMDGFLLAYAFFGGGVSVYETKPKTEVLSSENEDVNKVLKSAQIKTYSDKSGFNQAGEEVKLNETQVKSINDLRNSYIERKLSGEVAKMKKMSDHDIDNRVDKIKSDATKYAKYKVVGYLLSDTKKNLREAAEAMLTPREKELPTTKRNARIEWYIKQFDKDQEKELERLEREFR